MATVQHHVRAAAHGRQAGEPWHARPAAEVLEALESSPSGLPEAAIAARRARWGENRLPEPPRPGALLRLARQFHNVLIYVLIASGIVTLLMGHLVDSGVILGVVVINAAIGFVQEGKAESALDGLRRMLSPAATVLRDGRRRSIAAEALVPGDVVILEPGDRVPADLRLLLAHGLEVQEAVLTGESLAVPKAASPVPADAVLPERGSMAFSGTLVTRGHARGVVVATGGATEIGRIGHLIAGAPRMTTPLLRRLASFGRTLTVAILALAGVTFAFGTLVRDFAADAMFLAAVGLAVAAIPEGLPAIMTIGLAVGVQRMARRRAIIRRLPAVETLGSVTVICSDKTGTLTRNEMMVEGIATASALFEVSGAGYAPDGTITRGGAAPAEAELAGLAELARAGALCCDAALRESGDGWTVEGDPMEGAILALAARLGVDMAQAQAAMPRLDVIPFDAEHRFMASLHRQPDGFGQVLVKGAPERLLELCDRQRDGLAEMPLDLAWWHARQAAMAGTGQRLLAVAVRRLPPDRRQLAMEDLEEGLTLLGLLGLSDPPREEAVAAVRRCQDAGIRVKMITGDHPATALAIAGRLGLATGPGALTGRDLDLLDEAGLAQRAGEVDVFARTSPEHKLRLVHALQRAGQIVAMTGDGVNDAPALKSADVGIAMGRKGTEAAKEAAEMVLADDDFASIAAAVEEGRTVYRNLRKAIVFILPTNGGEALTIIGAILAGLPLPITAVQILWINMVTTVTLALALAFEPAELGIMRQRPRRPDAPLLSRFLAWRVVFVSLIMVAAVFGVFFGYERAGADMAVVRTAAVNTLVLLEAVYLLNCRHLVQPVLTREGLLGSPLALGAIATVVLFQLLFTYAPPMQLMFGTAPLAATDWLVILLAALPLLFLVEIEKRLLRGRAAPAPAEA
ncbi:HAD-IC family P-type ATPase [Geminicoccaceae bacterium 1502E]|nr:HAD-IC family P-type ATPase [Geminicoccaceae bacterium 1502E]